MCAGTLKLGWYVFVDHNTGSFDFRITEGASARKHFYGVLVRGGRKEKLPVALTQILRDPALLNEKGNRVERQSTGQLKYSYPRAGAGSMFLYVLAAGIEVTSVSWAEIVPNKMAYSDRGRPLALRGGTQYHGPYHGPILLPSKPETCEKNAKYDLCAFHLKW